MSTNKMFRLMSVLTILLLATTAYAQTTIYTADFNAVQSDWTLNTTDEGSVTGTPNEWIINSSYAGFLSLIPDTPNQPAGITGSPQSGYLHITEGSFADNANFQAPANGNKFAKMNTGINTTGYTGVEISFWYLCNGGSSNYVGRLYYSTNGGTSWNLAATYQGVSTWTQTTFSDSALDNKTDVRFAFMWVQSGGSSATDPPLAVDEIIVTGSGSSCPITIDDEQVSDASCAGVNDGTINITATGTNLEYSIDGGSNFQANGGSFTGLAPGSYDVAVTNGNCTVFGSTLVVDAGSGPSAPTVGSNGPVCEGETLNLTCSSVGGATYSWSGPNSFTSSSQNPSISGVTTAASGTYNVTITVNGCTATASTTVTVNQGPGTVTAGNDGPACEGETINLTSTTVVGATYSWSGPNNYSSSSQNPALSNVTTSESGTYSVTVTLGSCSSTASTNVQVTTGVGNLTATNNGPLCEGQTLNLSVGSIGGATYSWSGPNGFSSSSSDPSISNVTTADAGTYSVTVTLGSCSGTASTSVTINPGVVALTAGSNSPICEGDDILLTATTVPGASYTWTGPNTYASSQQNPTISGATAADEGTYTVSATANNCTASSSVTIDVQAATAAEILGLDSSYCQNGFPDVMVGTPPNGQFSGPGVFNDTFNPKIAGPGIHTIFYSGSDNCGTTVSVEVEVIDCDTVGIDEVLVGAPEIFPVPFNEQVSVRFQAKYSMQVTIELTDISGKRLYRHEQQVSAGNVHHTLPAKGLAGGLYLLRITAGSQTATYKVVKAL